MMPRCTWFGMTSWFEFIGLICYFISNLSKNGKLLRELSPVASRGQPISAVGDEHAVLWLVKLPALHRQSSD